MGHLNMNISHGDLDVRIRHGEGGGGADVARFVIIAVVAYVIVTAVLAAIVAIALALAMAAVVAVVALAFFWRVRVRCDAALAEKLQAARELREAEDARREIERHHRRLEIAAASAPRIVIGADLLAAATQPQAVHVIRGEVSR